MNSERSHRVGIDIGGTFTDLVLIDDASGERAIGKVLTTPGDPSEAVEEGLRGLLQREGVEIASGVADRGKRLTLDELEAIGTNSDPTFPPDLPG